MQVFSGSGSHGIFVQFGGKLEADGIEVSPRKRLEGYLAHKKMPTPLGPP